MKKLLLSIIFAFWFTGTAAAATRYLVPNGTAGACTALWSDAKCWGATSYTGVPGTYANGQTVPGSSDDVFCDANSGTNVSTNSANRTALTFDGTGCVNTITITAGNSLLVAGNITLGSGMTIAASGAGTGIFGPSNTANVTTNGVTIPNFNIASAGSITITFVGTVTVSGSFTTNTTTGTTTLSSSAGSVITVSGSLTANSCTSGSIASGGAGGVSFVLNGTGAWAMTGNTGTCAWKTSVEINTSGTITVTSGSTMGYQVGVLKHTAGTFVTTNTTWKFAAGATVTSNVGKANLVFPTMQITGGNQIWNGSFGFTMGTLSCLVANLTHTLTNGNTYDITSGFITTATSAQPTTFTSPGSANINFTGSAVALVYANFTNIVASGTALQTYQGTVSGSGSPATITQTTTIPTGGGGGGYVF